jgi:hypothetical protein
LTFESGSKLTRIDAEALSGCSSLTPIVIPWSIKELSKDWALSSSLRHVIFESALSLRKMIETDNVDLREGFEIKFAEYDCSSNLPGYSVQTISGVKDFVHLVSRI